MKRVAYTVMCGVLLWGRVEAQQDTSAVVARTAVIAGTAQPADTAGAPRYAPVFLEPGHWAYDALLRLNRAGAGPSLGDPVTAPVTLRHARAVFDSAARSGPPSIAEEAAGYRRLLSREEVVPGAPLVLRVRAGWAAAAGDALGGDGYCRGEMNEPHCPGGPEEADWQGALPLPDASAPVVAVRAHGHVLPRLGWSFDGGRVADEWEVLAAAATLSAGPFDVWGGRRRLQYGVGRSGGIVIGTGHDDVHDVAHRTAYRFDGAGIHVRDPFRFPGILGFLGEGRVEMVAGRLARKGQVRHPYVIFGRLFATPFSPRFELGVNRGAIFGGEGIPITAGRLAGLFIGLHGGDTGEFENQVFSAIARYRPPLGALPVELYVEAGMDDTSGAIKNMPTWVAGVGAGPLPGVPALSLGVERTRFPGSCCGNPIWYRSIFYRGSWTDRGRLIAHPIAGHGYEWRAHAQVAVPGSGLLVRSAAFRRERGFENLLAPERAGRSHGGSAAVEYRHAGGTTLRLDGAFERGSGWDAHRFAVVLEHPFALTGRLGRGSPEAAAPVR